MTDAQLVDYYTNLLIIQYHGKPKAKATVAGLVTPLVLGQLPLKVQGAFTLGSAVGAQLDVIGKYIGVSRKGYTPSGPITLSDLDYTTVLKLVLIKNTAGSSLATIQELLAANFGGKILVSDNATMQLNYTITSDIGSATLVDFLTYGSFMPKPMSVQVSVTVIAPHTNNFYGWRTYLLPGFNVSPMNSYLFYQTTYPWLSYTGVISV